MHTTHTVVLYVVVLLLYYNFISWWRHQMETFSALLAVCAGNSPVPGEFPTQRPVTRSFGVFFDLRLKQRSSKQWWGWWFETLSRPLWRHRNVPNIMHIQQDSECRHTTVQVVHRLLKSQRHILSQCGLRGLSCVFSKGLDWPCYNGTALCWDAQFYRWVLFNNMV